MRERAFVGGGALIEWIDSPGVREVLTEARDAISLSACFFGKSKSKGKRQKAKIKDQDRLKPLIQL
jgi:hypothetical protein